MSQKPAGAYKPRDPMTLQSVLAYERVDHGPILVPKSSGFSFNAQGYYERWANRNPYSQRKTVKGPGVGSDLPVVRVEEDQPEQHTGRSTTPRAACGMGWPRRRGGRGMRHDECQACMGNVMAGMTCTPAG